MAKVFESTPALIWRAFCFIILATAAGVSWAAAPNASAPPELAQVGLPDAAKSREILAKFREAAIPGKYYLEFELHALPRRGEEKVYRGQIWGSHNDQGAITRVHLVDAAGVTQRWLLQNGLTAAAWGLVNRRPAPLGNASLLAPLLPGVDISAFDLLMPYLYWTDAGLPRLERVRGRPAFAYVFQSPPAFAQAHPEASTVRAYLDTQFNAMMQAERRGIDGRVLATLTLGELKKIDEQWMLKSVDFRNEVTHDKTRLLVTAAALNLDLGSAIFEPGRLADEIAAPRADLIKGFSP